MNHSKILIRVVGIFEQRKLKTWAFLGALLFAFSFCTILKPPYVDLLLVNLQWSRGINLKMLTIMDSRYEATSNTSHTSLGEIPKINPESLLDPICNFSGEKSDFCEIINGDVRIHGNSSTIFFTSPHLTTVPQNTTLGIKLYARKSDKDLMPKLKQQNLKPTSSDHELPKCTVNHTIPAVVFHGGGYAGNLFHAVSDVIIPLYLTASRFGGEVQFLVEEKYSWWVRKFGDILKALSKYDIIDLDRDDEIRCFRSAIVGLKAHGDFGIDPETAPFGYTLRNFTHFMRQTFSLERDIANSKGFNSSKLRLLIISRQQTRRLVNEDEVAAEARGLGFDTEIIDARLYTLKDFAKKANTFDVMVGVHGAGLTNMVFLPENAILVQVVPIALESVSWLFYERPAKNMNLKYLQYKVSVNESSLIERYRLDDPVMVEPKLIEGQGWLKFKSAYMDNQDVRVDIGKFRMVLLEALRLLS